MVFATLLTTVLLALTLAAEPIPVKRSLATSPVYRRVNVNRSARNILQHDQLRAQALQGKKTNAVGMTRQISIPAENAGVDYLVSISVGNPPTTCKRLQQLVVDQTFANIFTDECIVDTGR
jgi:cathepsin E